MKRLYLYFGWIFCWLFFATPFAFAKQIAPLVPKMIPSKPTELVIRFHDEFAKGLQDGGLEILNSNEVREKLGQKFVQEGCLQLECVDNAQKILGVTSVASIEINTVGKNYTIVVHYYEGNSLLREESGRCDICTLAEALKTVYGLATKIAEESKVQKEDKVSKISPTVLPPQEPEKEPTPVVEETPKISSSPEDDKKPVTTGEQKVLVSKTKEAPGLVGVAKEKWPVWPAIAAAGAGVVGVLIGVPLLAIDGSYVNCDDRSDIPEEKRCRDKYKTGAGGALMTGLGFVGLSASAVLFYLHFKEKREEKSGVNQVSLIPISQGGIMLGAIGRF